MSEFFFWGGGSPKCIPGISLSGQFLDDPDSLWIVQTVFRLSRQFLMINHLLITYNKFWASVLGNFPFGMTIGQLHAWFITSLFKVLYTCFWKAFATGELAGTNQEQELKVKRDCQGREGCKIEVF